MKKQYSEAEIDALVKKLGDYVEKNYNEMINKKHSVLRSGLSIIFAGVSGGTSILHKTAEANDIPVTKWHETLDKIIAATEARGSNAADKIKTTIVKTKELDQLFKDMGIGNDLKDGWKKIKIAKQQP